MSEHLNRKERRQLQKLESKQKRAETEISSVKKKIRSRILWIIVCLAVVSLIVWAYYSFRSDPYEYDVFARCLSEKGIIMYGAYWCSHCQEQKEMFLDSFEFVNYIECASPRDSQKMTEQCKTAGVQGYPTWIFPGNVKLSGTQSLDKLSKMSGCALQ